MQKKSFISKGLSILSVVSVLTPMPNAFAVDKAPSAPLNTSPLSVKLSDGELIQGRGVNYKSPNSQQEHCIILNHSLHFSHNFYSKNGSFNYVSLLLFCKILFNSNQ